MIVDDPKVRRREGRAEGSTKGDSEGEGKTIREARSRHDRDQRLHDAYPCFLLIRVVICTLLCKLSSYRLAVVCFR